jgi:hypothetical protein
MARHPFLTILMVLGGLILLLPGVCAIVFMTMGGLGTGDSALVSLWFACFLVSAGGVVLIVKAFR